LVLFFVLKTNSPAPNAHAPIARDGRIPADKARYGTAKNVPPNYRRNY
jgi:hypothetical protein